MTFDQLVAYLRVHDDYLILSHSDPDGDAVGSELGLLAVLRGLGKSASILNSDQCQEKFRVFDTAGDLKSLEEGHRPPPDLGRKTLILIDTSDFHHTHRAKDTLLPWGREVILIDHHTPPQQLPCPGYIDDTAAASSQIVVQLALELGIKVPLDSAKALFMGIVYDTGSFIYPKTTTATFEAARALVAWGVKPKEIHAALYETISIARMRLMARVQATLRFVHNDRTALQILEHSMLVQTNASVEDSENFINYPLKCPTVEVSLFLKEGEPGHFRCSLRSKGDIDVSSLALAYGGGGHRTAAGFPCPPLPLAELESVLLESILELYSKDSPV